MKSTGFGADWTLAENGYVGTYIVLDEAGDVTVSANAAGTSSGGVNPHMNIVLADESAGWNVGPGFDDYEHTFHLPAGTYFLRTEFNNDAEMSSRELTLHDLTITGASVNNSSSSSVMNANALAAADTYINNFRKGKVTVALPGASPGTTVDVKLKKHDFMFGTAVGGFNNISPGDQWMVPIDNPNSDAYKLQHAILDHFNTIVPGNAGKWQQNEYDQDSLYYPVLQNIFNFAETNDLRMRMHNLIWANQQPSWVNTLLSQASGGSTSAKNALRQEISERIDYYIGDGFGSDWSDRYNEVDILNEAIHESVYMDIFGADGVADIYNEAAAAVAATGNDVKLFANEYNVLQDSSDFYGNWYKNHIEELLAEGGAVEGIGIQSYENDAIGTSYDAHNVARKMQTLQNLSVLGLPITLTEFGVKYEPGNFTSESDATTMMEDTVRLAFGTPNANGFFMWGFWEGDIYRGAAAFYDEDWNLREPGERWIDLFSADGDADPNDDWDTQLTAMVGSDGTIEFDGFWGDYELTIGGEIFDLSLLKGTTDYSLTVGPVLYGDYNGNGEVDAADYVVWRDAMAAGVTWLLNDDSPGSVTDADFSYWRAHFGDTLGSGAGAAAAVPEPNGALALLLGALLLAGAPRRRVQPESVACSRSPRRS